jgi:hypothetical protein
VTETDTQAQVTATQAQVTETDTQFQAQVYRARAFEDFGPPVELPEPPSGPGLLRPPERDDEPEG